ncbi:MAG: DUF4366 domain-containing protein [Clostridia bacterium]|nr:DUF4366 domain-containing protein [Clostridia bacterium]
MDEENKDKEQEELEETKPTEKVEINQQENKTTQEPTIQENKQEEKVPEKEKEETKKYETFKPVQEAPTKKKSKKGILISLLILILVVVGLGAYYYFEIYKDTKTIYQEALKDGIKSLTETSEEITKMKAKVKLGLNVELEDEIKEYAGEEYIDDILDLINKTEIGLEIQMDKEQQQLLYKIDSTYEKEDLIKMNMLIDAKKENVYMQLEQFFNKVLKVEMTNTEAFQALREAFETDKITLAEEMTQSKALTIISKELSKAIKDEYCSKDKEKIDIDSKEVSVDEYTLKMTGEQLVKEISTIVDNLKENKEFTKCFIDEDQIKDELEAIKEELEDIEVEDTQFAIKLYKKGISQDLVRVDINVSADGVVAEVQITKTQEGYKFKILQSGMTLMSGTIKQEKVNENTAKTDIEIKIQQVGKIRIKLESSYETGTDIDEMDTVDAIETENLTEQEMEEAYNKLQRSKLYELVEKYVKLFTGNSLENVLDSTTKNNITNNNSNSSSNNSSTNKTTSENQIKTYSEEKTITFNIPVGYKAEYSSDTSKNFSKGDTLVGVSSFYSNKDTYLTSMVDSYVETFENSGYYKNIEKSEEKTIQVNGRTFYYIELSYEYYDEKYKETFICTPVSDKEVYTVQISSLEGIENLDIQAFLNIQY